MGIADMAPNEHRYREVQQKVPKLEAEIARLRDEVERYRKDAERYRWLRNEAHMVDGMYPAVIVAGEDFPVDDPRTDGFVFHDELDIAIDAAMGASA